MGKKGWIVLVLVVLLGTGLVLFLRALKPVDEGVYLDRDFRYDDTIPLKDAWRAFMDLRFADLDSALERMSEVEKTSSRQTPILGFLSLAGQADQKDRCLLWTRQRPESAFAWLSLADAQNAEAFRSIQGYSVQEVKQRISTAAFHEAQVLVEECLRKAAAADPKSAYPVARQIGLDMVLGRDRKTMERHYQAALKLSPFCLMAYLLKADYLKPEWHGRWEDYEEYIFSVVKRFPPNTLIPMALLMNYNFEYALLNDPGYIMRNETWVEVSAMFEAYLKENPGDVGVRSLYFRLLSERQMRRASVPHARALQDFWGPVWILGGWANESAFKETIARRLEGDNG